MDLCFGRHGSMQVIRHTSQQCLWSSGLEMGRSIVVEVCFSFELLYVDKLTRLDVLAVTISRRSLGCDHLWMQSFDRRNIAQNNSTLWCTRLHMGWDYNNWLIICISWGYMGEERNCHHYQSSCVGLINVVPYVGLVLFSFLINFLISLCNCYSIIAPLSPLYKKVSFGLANLQALFRLSHSSNQAYNCTRFTVFYEKISFLFFVKPSLTPFTHSYQDNPLMKNMYLLLCPFKPFWYMRNTMASNFHVHIRTIQET